MKQTNCFAELKNYNLLKYQKEMLLTKNYKKNQTARQSI